MDIKEAIREAIMSAGAEAVGFAKASRIPDAVAQQYESWIGEAAMREWIISDVMQNCASIPYFLRMQQRWSAWPSAMFRRGGAIRVFLSWRATLMERTITT